MDQKKLKPIGSYVIGQIVEYVGITKQRGPMCDLVGGEWYVVNTEPRQEPTARDEIEQKGLVAYLPMLAREESHGRGQYRHATRPMFPGYLIARCASVAEHWHLIKAARGVIRILGTSEPKPVPAEAIEAIRLYETDEAEKAAALRRSRSLGRSGIVWHFTAEQRVKILTGPFAGFFAQLSSCVDSSDRVVALVEMFGRHCRANLSAFDLSAL